MHTTIQADRACPNITTIGGPTPSFQGNFTINGKVSAVHTVSANFSSDIKCMNPTCEDPLLPALLERILKFNLSLFTYLEYNKDSFPNYYALFDLLPEDTQEELNDMTHFMEFIYFIEKIDVGGLQNQCEIHKFRLPAISELREFAEKVKLSAANRNFKCISMSASNRIHNILPDISLDDFWNRRKEVFVPEREIRLGRGQISALKLTSEVINQLRDSQAALDLMKRK